VKSISNSAGMWMTEDHPRHCWKLFWLINWTTCPLATANILPRQKGVFYVNSTHSNK